jgi:DNA polymerase III subunit delta
MKAEIQNLVQDIRSGRIRPVYFLFGEESYFIDSLIRELRTKIVRPETRDFNYDMLHAEETDGDAAVAIASSFPLMAERRLLVLKSVQKFPPSDKKRILAYVEAPLESTCLVLTAPDADRRQSFYGELTKLAVSVECKPLYADGAAQWVERAVRARGGQISKEAAVLLVEQVGVQLWSLSGEIEKLMTFAGPKTALGLAEVEAAAGFSRKYNQWDFADAVGNREFSLAMVIMRRLLREKSSETGLIVELSRRVVLLMRVRSLMDAGSSRSSINAAIKVNPYFVDRYIEQARNYTVRELRAANRSLLGADVLIKTGGLDPLTALTLAVYDLIRGAKNKRYFHENAA